MKIGLLTASGNADDPVPAHLLEVVGPDTELVNFPVRLQTFAYSPAEFVIQQVNFVESGLRAAAAGCDRIVYVSVADYGIEALRSLVEVPVIGAGETTYAALSASGTDFSIVTVWPKSTNFVHDRLTHQHNADQLRVNIHNISRETVISGAGRPDDFISRMQDGEKGTFDAIMAACQAVAERDGASTVVLGCTCMSQLAARIRAEAPLPVIDPFAAAIRHAEKDDFSPAAAPTVRGRPEAAKTLQAMIRAIA